MKKVIVIIMVALSVMLPLKACQVIVHNNGDMAVFVADLDTNKIQVVQPESHVNANQNPASHAHIRIIFNPGTVAQKSYRIDQITCSKTHTIPVTTDEILNNAVNRSLLRLKKE